MVWLFLRLTRTSHGRKSPKLCFFFFFWLLYLHSGLLYLLTLLASVSSWASVPIILSGLGKTRQNQKTLKNITWLILFKDAENSPVSSSKPPWRVLRLMGHSDANFWKKNVFFNQKKFEISGQLENIINQRFIKNNGKISKIL